MNDHERIREFLPLAAAGALDNAEERELEAHLTNCSECSAELEVWHGLGGALRRIPTPLAPPALVNRVHIQLLTHAIRETERQRTYSAFFWLILFGWAMTFATWPVLQIVSTSAGNWLHWDFLRTWYGPATFSLLSWLAAAAATAVLCLRHNEDRRLA